jgi:hypothetical protein
MSVTFELAHGAAEVDEARNKLPAHQKHHANLDSGRLSSPWCKVHLQPVVLRI